MEGEDRRADHDDEVMFTQRVRKLSRRGVQETRKLRMFSGKGTARREWAGPDSGPGFSASFTIRSTASARSTPGPTTRAGRLLSDSADTSVLIAAGSGPSSRLTLARLDRLRGAGPVVDRHRDECRSARRLHRDIIGARDRRRHILGPRRLDAEFHVRLREFRRALGIEKSLQRHDRAGLLARDDHHRRLVAIGVEDITERMADAGSGMKVDETGVTGRLRIAIGHADDGGLLQAEHVVDVVGPVG